MESSLESLFEATNICLANFNLSFSARARFLYIRVVVCKLLTFVYKRFAFGVKSADFGTPNSFNNVFGSPTNKNYE